MELNKIYNENCLDTMARMPDGLIDLTVTSPPYDNLRDYNGYEFDFESIAKELFRVTKTGGVVVWVVGDATVNGSETGTSFKQALFFKEIGFRLHDTMIYFKNSVIFPDANRYHPSFEFMFVFSKNAPKTTNLLKDRKNRWGNTTTFGNKTERNKDGTLKSKGPTFIADFGIRFNVWTIQSGKGHSTKDKDAYTHPAIFPEQLAKDHILSWSNENDLIYDPFMGSGTTAKAAYLLKRNWIGSEISAEYVELANKRLEPYLMQETLF